MGKDVFPKVPSDSKIYKRCEYWIKENCNQNIEMTKDVIEMYIQWFNELLVINKKHLLRKIFNYEVEAEKIAIKDYGRKKKLEVQWEDAGERYSATEVYIRFPKQETYSRGQFLRMNAYICWNILMEGIAAPLYTPIIKGRRMGEPVYLPASRTGFMLTYPQLITKFETKSKVNKKNAWIIDYIEQNMTKGNLSVKKDMVPLIQYHPKGVDKEIPLWQRYFHVSIY